MLLDSFTLHLQAENKSASTVEGYVRSVRQLAAYLATDDPAVISRSHVEQFITHVIRQHSSATANTRYRALQQYFKWLAAEGEVAADPMLGMRPPKFTEVPPSTLDDQAIVRILKACNGNTFDDRRDLAMFRLLLDTGVRRAELVGMTLADLNLSNRIVVVTGKGDKVRLLPLGTKAAHDIDRYLRARRGHKHADSDKLWIGAHGPLGVSGVNQIVEKRAKQAGVKAHPHLFRHTFVDLWLSSDGAEGDLQQIAGWNSRTMIGRYAKARAAARAREAHRRLSPGDRF